MNASNWWQVAMGSFQAGRLDEAEGACRRVLEVEAQSADAMHMLGAICGRRGRHGDAVDWFSRAVAAAPNRGDLYSNYVYALGSVGRMEEALGAYVIMRSLGYEKLDLLISLGLAFRERKQWGRAIDAFEMALVAQPDFFDALVNLSLSLRDAGETGRALAMCLRAAEAQPSNANVLVNLCGMLAAEGQVEAAMERIERAVALAPGLAIARRNRGQLRLLSGDFEGGWKDYEWRWKQPGRELGVTPRATWWDGRPLSGERIYLLAEQGYGDAIQFIRYAKLAAERGGDVAVVCRGELAELLRSASGVRETREEEPGAEALCCPLMNLPGVFGTTAATIPAEIPYLSARREKAARWRGRLEGQPGMKVGLAWAGGRGFARDRYRSIGASVLAPLVGLAGICWVSLQKGEQAKEAAGLGLLDFTDELDDFSDTAGLIENLDLVIGVDTAVVHLAGAMGKAVWTLIALAPDWRWMREREDSPWYPTMRLFRQKKQGDWGEVMGRVEARLREGLLDRRGGS